MAKSEKVKPWLTIAQNAPRRLCQRIFFEPLSLLRRMKVSIIIARNNSHPSFMVTMQNPPPMNRRLQSPVVLETLSRLPLDRELTSAEPTPLRDANLGGEAGAALTQRRQWLIEQGLAEQQGDQTIYRANMLAVLRRREVSRVVGQLSEELGLRYAEPRAGEPVEGIYRRQVDLVSGPYALIENGRDFALVPWRPVLERNLGKEVSGIARGETISWSLGRRRQGPSIS